METIGIIVPLERAASKASFGYFGSTKGKQVNALEYSSIVWTKFRAIAPHSSSGNFGKFRMGILEISPELLPTA